MADGDQIRIVSVAPPTEDTPALQAEADLVAQARAYNNTAETMRKVAEVNRWYRMVGGQDR